MSRTKSLKPGRIVLVGILAGLSIWSCGGSDEETIRVAKLAEGCSRNSQCVDPLVCTFARCHEQCKQDRDCPGAERCVQGDSVGVCQLPDDTVCTRDVDCQGEQRCGVDGECRDVCETEDDCFDGQICANSGECASTLKDMVDDEGNILMRPRPITGEGGAGGVDGGGTSGSTSGGTAGKGGGTAGSGATSPGGATGISGEGGEGGGGTEGDAGAGGTDGSAGAGGMGCPMGMGDCDDDPSTCETDLSLNSSCGACDTVCDASKGGDVQCDAETLSCVIDPNTCTAGFADCDEDAATGCEAPLKSDPMNCGACGHDCGGGECVNGQCGAVVIMDPPGDQYYQYATGRLLGNRLIWEYNYSTTLFEIRSMALPAGATPVEGTVIHSRMAQTTISTSTYETNRAWFAVQANNPSSVLTVPLDSATNPVAATEAFQFASYPRLITTTATAFYFVAPISGAGTGIYSRSKTGTDSPVPIVSNRSANIYQLIVGGSRLYWQEYATAAYRIFSAPLGGGEAVELDANVGTTNAYVTIAVDATHAYWNQYLAAGKIRRVPHTHTNNTTVEDVAASASYPQNGLVLDATHVYFGGQSSTLYRVRKGVNQQQELITQLNRVPYFYNLFGVDAGFMYGIGNQGQVLRVSKAPAP